VKSIAGLMNASGGSLLVGVSDTGTTVGIQEDYPFLRKQDRDGWELWLTDLVSTSLGKVAASDLTVSICDIDGGDVARIDVGPTAEPVFAMTLRGETQHKFMVRLNNSTRELVGHEIVDYMKRRWPN
jgi:predicted HTH transcriptional regulator